MPQFESGILGRIFGEGVFENDAALHAVAYLDELACVNKFKPTDSADDDGATYSVYAKQCSTPKAAERVRVHLDSGVLHKLTAKMVANYFTRFPSMTTPVSATFQSSWAPAP